MTLNRYKRTRDVDEAQLHAFPTLRGREWCQFDESKLRNTAASTLSLDLTGPPCLQDPCFGTCDELLRRITRQTSGGSQMLSIFRMSFLITIVNVLILSGSGLVHSATVRQEPSGLALKVS